MGFEDKTGMKVGQSMQYGFAILALLVILGVGSSYITVLLGVAYPVFQSFCCLDSGDDTQATQWLTYWVVSGLFQMLDHFAGFLLAIIPFYYVLRCSLWFSFSTHQL